MKIALAQIDTTVGDFQGNVESIRRMSRRAAQEGAKLIVFPELTVTGYSPRDLVEIPHFVEKSEAALVAIAPASKDIAILLGYVAKNARAGEKPLYNAAALLADGVVKHSYAKRLLPSYDVFDEGRYFEPGREPGIFEIDGVRFGITICEDIWNDKNFWEKPQYKVFPVDDLAQRGIDALITLSASPFGWDKEMVRLDMLKALSKRHQFPIYYCNLVGGNDDLVFDGRSTVLNADGEIVAEAKGFEEDLLIVDDPSAWHPQPSRLPKDDIENVFQALILGVRDYAYKCGFKGAVLGLSGGIDSSLTAVIAAEALGADRVLGVLMPSPYTSDESVEDAQALAEQLGISTETIGIDEAFAAYRQSLKKVFAGRAEDTTEENLQARIRGNILMAFSNKMGQLVLSTGNKSEIAVGYCTLYGDMSGGLAVLSDVPKTMVYHLAKWINRNKTIIPERVLVKPPSAELRPNQKDQDTLPPYEVLDGILKLYIEDHLDREDIIAGGFDAETVDGVLDRVVRNEYKRKQMPVGIKICKKAFGLGRRFPIAKKD